MTLTSLHCVLEKAARTLCIVARGSDGRAGRIGLGRIGSENVHICVSRVQFDLMTKIYCKILRCLSYYTYINVLNIFNVVVYVYGDVTNLQQIV